MAIDSQRQAAKSKAARAQRPVARIINGTNVSRTKEDGEERTRFRTISLSINGQVQSRRVSTRKNLVDFIRDDLGLTGTHVGCEHGSCGACSVLLDGSVVRSCLVLAVQSHRRQITTVEGLGLEHLHVVQQAFWDHHALQCGFCTPGMLLTVVDLLKRKTALSESEVRAELSANLCRCTGYQFIVDAVMAAASRMRQSEKA
jgi:aerobic-type carbon monoxide dehydrogenase small subunit (CoxS/CutS family)